MPRIKKNQTFCKRCGNKWISKGGSKPKQCPKCSSKEGENYKKPSKAPIKTVKNVSKTEEKNN